MGRKAAWEARQQERERKNAEWEAERARKKAEWEAKQREFHKRQEARAARGARRAHAEGTAATKGADAESNATESTSASLPYDPELERIVLLDKEVRKLAKKLREIEKLETFPSRDPMQEDKVATKDQVKVDLEWATVLARL